MDAETDLAAFEPLSPLAVLATSRGRGARGGVLFGLAVAKTSPSQYVRQEEKKRVLQTIFAICLCSRCCGSAGFRKEILRDRDSLEGGRLLHRVRTNVVLYV